eukprot:SAG31_NODE_1882_length_7000_cov_3.469932_3_plen_109_part_00
MNVFDVRKTCSVYNLCILLCMEQHSGCVLSLWTRFAFPLPASLSKHPVIVPLVRNMVTPLAIVCELWRVLLKLGCRAPHSCFSDFEAAYRYSCTFIMTVYDYDAPVPL